MSAIGPRQRKYLPPQALLTRTFNKENVSSTGKIVVPSLPLFLVESRSVDTLNSKHGSKADTSTSNNGLVLKDLAKSSKKPSGKHRQSELSREHCSDEVLVHDGSRRKHRHHRHKSPQSTSKLARNMRGGVEHEISEEIAADGFNSPSISHHMTQHSTTEPSSRQLLVSQTSLDSGYQRSNCGAVLFYFRKQRRRHWNAVNTLLDSSLPLTLTSLFTRTDLYYKERDSLRNQMETLKHHYASQKQISESESGKSAALEEQNRGLVEDVTMLKNLVYRLNVALEKYQLRFHKKGLVGDTGEKEADALWTNLNRTALVPLLDAYSETIKEKDDLIHNYEVDLNKFVANCKQIVAENESLHQELEDLKKKNETLLSDWKVLDQDSALMQEQNQLLTGQLQLQKDKLQDLTLSCQEKIVSLTSECDSLKERYHHCRGELLAAQGQLSVLREEYDSVRKDSENKVPFSVHTAAVSECRRLLDELKLKYETERSQLSNQVIALQRDKPELEAKLAGLGADKKQHHSQVAALERLLKRTQQRCEDLQSQLVTAQVSRDASKRQLQKAMSFAEELVAEQERLLRQLHAKQEETDSMARLGTTIVCRMGSLKTKLKSVQKGAWHELEVIERRIKQQESGLEHTKEEYHREVGRLRNLIKQKEAIIGTLQREKCKTQEDLEVVWRAATSEDLCIKDRLKKVNILLPAKDSHLYLNSTSAILGNNDLGANMNDFRSLISQMTSDSQHLGMYSSPVASLVLTDSSQMTSDSQHLGIYSSPVASLVLTDSSQMTSDSQHLGDMDWDTRKYLGRFGLIWAAATILD
uniref:Uncharacterized protein n=1 Tax=Timema douglasi TaxID=61478 RepID=A0A7R8VLZ1_TIMDO|nr:unnamed protein product [Timema douglasi]